MRLTRGQLFHKTDLGVRTKLPGLCCFRMSLSHQQPSLRVLEGMLMRGQELALSRCPHVRKVVGEL